MPKPSASQPQTPYGRAKREWIKRHGAADLYGPYTCGLCGTRFRSEEKDPLPMCAPCFYRQFVNPYMGSRSIRIEHPRYE